MVDTAGGRARPFVPVDEVLLAQPTAAITDGVELGSGGFGHALSVSALCPARR
jgi:hypothetical protein